MPADKYKDYFLKLDGIDGESQDAKHPKEIQIETFKMNVENRGRRGDYKVGKPVHDDAVFTSYVDQAYPKIKLACAKGEQVPKAVLTCRKAGGKQQEYLKITLTDLFITSCTIDTNSDVMPIVTFTISFAKKQIEYREQKADGSLGGSIMVQFDLYGKR